MTVLSVLDSAGRRRSPATMPGYHAGRPPRNKGMHYPGDPPTVEEIVAVMRLAAHDRHGWRLRAMIVVLWRAGLCVQEALALAEHDLDPQRGSVDVEVAEQHGALLRCQRKMHVFRLDHQVTPHLSRSFGCMARSRRTSGSDSEGVDHELGDVGAGVLLLAGDELVVADREGLEEAGLNVVGAPLSGLVLDPEGHHALADGGVAEVLLDVGEAGDGLALDQAGAVGQLDVQQRADAMAQRRRGLLGFVEGPIARFRSSSSRNWNIGPLPPQTTKAS
jgi:hypothetical protein